MDISTLGFDPMTASFTVLATFGIVAAVNFWKKLDSKQNFALSVAVAVGLSFVPADLGNMIANKVKDGISVAVALNGAYQVLSKLIQKATSANGSAN